MSRPTVAELKAELRVDFTDDDALIERYIDAAADSIFAELNWIKAIPPAYQTIILFPRRLFERQAIKMPVRGLSAATIVYRTNAGADMMVAAGAQTFMLDNDLQSNRFHSYLIPVQDWKEVVPDIDYLENVKVRLSARADPPAAISLAITKCAVDLYRNNGMGSIPAMTAIGRLLAPIQDNM